MDENQCKELKEELVAVKKLLILGLQNEGIQGNTIAKALGITPGRLSQIMSKKKHGKKNE